MDSDLLIGHYRDNSDIDNSDIIDNSTYCLVGSLFVILEVHGHCLNLLTH